MVLYRRNRLAGGTYFFTVTLRNRKSSVFVDWIDDFRDCVRMYCVKNRSTLMLGWFCPNTYMRFGLYRRTMTITPSDGNSSRAGSPVGSSRRGCPSRKTNGVNMTYGRAAFGNTPSVMKLTSPITSIIFTTTPSNTIG